MASRGEKVVIVTGGGSGIGQATIVEFAKKNYNVVITGRTRSKLETTAAMCKADGLNDDNILIFVGDVTKPADNTSMISDTLTKFNRIDVLVNNAGYNTFRAFSQSSLESLDDMYRVHVRAVFDLTQKAMPHLLETKGNIINVSSAWATLPAYMDVACSMMKACLDHFTRAISVDYAPRGVRVNTVNPGATDVLNDSSPDEAKAVMEAFSRSQPIGKCIEPRAVAMMMVFLASDDAAFITGANVPVDGGYRNTMALPK